MVLDLFSSMDFFWFSGLNCLVWVVSIIWVVFLFMSNTSVTRFSSFFNFLSCLVLNKNLQTIHFKMKGSSLYFVGLFVFVFLSNFWGLNVYVFGWTSHMLVMFPLSFFIWMSLNLSNVCNKFNKYFSHLTPLGAPLILAPVLTVFELMSNFMRPLTLALRLGMNMTTGHIFISLLSTMTCSMYFHFFLSKSFFLFVQLVGFYFFFEVGMSFMQGFVFSLLVSQYYEEHSEWQFMNNFCFENK